MMSIALSFVTYADGGSIARERRSISAPLEGFEVVHALGPYRRCAATASLAGTPAFETFPSTESRRSSEARTARTDLDTTPPQPCTSPPCSELNAVMRGDFGLSSARCVV